MDVYMDVPNYPGVHINPIRTSEKTNAHYIRKQNTNIQTPYICKYVFGLY